MKVSDYVIDFIVQQGVGHIFEFIGGAITHLLDSTYHRQDIQCVSVHHEQAGAFAAEAYARINGKLGVAMATSGPGALNMITGIGSCYFDSVPCLFITGQVNTYEYKFDRPVRQIGFQETDIVSVAKPLTKYAHLIVDAEQIRYQLEKAVFLAQTGRPGPVLLDIPMNIQRAQVDPDKLPSFYASEEYRQLQGVNACKEKVLQQTLEAMTKAQRPVVLAGGGIRTAGAHLELQEFVDKTGIPVVTSLMGVDSISHDQQSFCGMIGSYGNRFSNLVLANCDFLLILGARLDSRQTGTRPDTFARAATKVHVDIDPAELNAKIVVDIALNCDVKDFLKAINSQLADFSKPDLSNWYERIELFKERYPTYSEPETPGGIDPNRFMEVLSSRCAEGNIVTLDVGQHQMWAGQSFRLKQGQRMLISGGMGAMGFALPAGLGAAKAAPGERVVVIAGDGGIQLNIQELDCIVRDNLPLKIFVMHNQCLGMVRQFQDMYFEGRRQSTVKGYSCPDLPQIARAYGVPAFTINSLEGAEEVIDQALEVRGPAFVVVNLEQATTVNPKLVVNRPIGDMSPHLDRRELEQIMLIDLAPDMDFEK